MGGHDPQIGRFWQVDPLAEQYVHNSVYAFSENKVTSYVELEGLEAESIHLPATGTRSVPGLGPLSGVGFVYNSWSDRVDAIKADPYKYSETGYGQMLIKQREEVVANYVVGAVIETAPAVARVVNKAIDKLGEAVDKVQQAVADAKPTSRAARREAMRKAGIPTSQPLVQDKKTNSKDKVYLTREGEYTVQDAKNDESHQNEPHWEAGRTKKDEAQPDGIRRSGTGRSNTNKPQIQAPKGKSFYQPQ